MTKQQTKIIVSSLPCQRKRDHYTEKLSCIGKSPNEIFLFVSADTRPITIEHLKKKSKEGLFNFIDETKARKLTSDTNLNYRKSIFSDMLNSKKHCILVLPHSRLRSELDFLTEKFN